MTFNKLCFIFIVQRVAVGTMIDKWEKGSEFYWLRKIEPVVRIRVVDTIPSNNEALMVEVLEGPWSGENFPVRLQDLFEIAS